MIIIW